jgi:hypothetical protein
LRRAVRLRAARRSIGLARHIVFPFRCWPIGTLKGRSGYSWSIENRRYS